MDKPNLTEREIELNARANALLHAIQSGVAHKMQGLPMNGQHTGETSPKHLRVGVSNAIIMHSALVKTLVDAKVISMESYLENYVALLQEEKQRYEQELAGLFGRKVTLL